MERILNRRLAGAAVMREDFPAPAPAQTTLPERSHLFCQTIEMIVLCKSRKPGTGDAKPMAAES